MRLLLAWTIAVFHALVLNGLTLAQGAPADTARRPNIVLIVADDLGYGETGVQGGKDIPTPNIDSLAAGGVRFTNAYVTCPVCAPTRAGLLSGRYGQRFGFEHNPGPQDKASVAFGLPLDQKTLAEKLKDAGYATGMFGKWHLGSKDGLTPLRRGFDEFYGFLGGAHAYLPGTRARAPGSSGIFRMDRPAEAPEYLTDALAQEAVTFIDAHKGAPFFVYLPFNAVHNPLQATDKYLQRFAHDPNPKRRTFAAMLSAMDDGIGRVLQKLRDENLEDDTLVLFISDNGGPTAQTTSGNGPLRGFKGQVWEGGIHVPCMVQWKGRVPAGTVYDRPVISLDLHATALGAAGLTPEPVLDGCDLLPFLTGDSPGAPHQSLCWRFGGQSAVRAGDWKLVMLPGQGAQLFNLADDLGEAHDLADAMPERVTELRGQYDSWNSRNIPAKWGRSDGARRRVAPKGAAAPTPSGGIR